MIFQPINVRVIGKRNNPRNHIIPKTDKIKTTRSMELLRPDLKDYKGNFVKCMGLTINILIPATNIRAVLGSP